MKRDTLVGPHSRASQYEEALSSLVARGRRE
jgi:hypothetical protein